MDLVKGSLLGAVKMAPCIDSKHIRLSLPLEDTVGHIFQPLQPIPALEMAMLWLHEQDCRFKIWSLFNFIQQASMELAVSSQKVPEEKVAF